MGNCYTFNHYTRARQYTIRQDGKRAGLARNLKLFHGFLEGLRVRIGPTSNETIPWDEKSASAVYISRAGVAMTSESQHFAPRPYEMTEMMIVPVSVS